MPNDRMSSIKNKDQYEALREKGYSKEKSARIANSPDASQKGGQRKPYEERTFKELYKLAQKIGIEGRSTMNKTELIEALRSGQ